MMRIRTIKPEWLEDERMAEASSDARVLSIALILLADDAGRGRLNRATAARCFPADPATFDQAFAELSGWFVERYDVRGQGYYAIVNWSKHQRIDKPSKPRTPEPPGDHPESNDSEGMEAQTVTQEITPNGYTRESSRDPRETLASPPGPFPDGPGPGPIPGEPRASARVAQRVPRSSLSGLRDPLGEWADGVSSEEYPWRAFRAEGGKLGLHVPPHPGHNDRSKAMEIEQAALDGARLAHERTGRDMADAFRRLVTMAVREYAKRRREKPSDHPWKIGYIASAWADLTENAIPARAT